MTTEPTQPDPSSQENAPAEGQQPSQPQGSGDQSGIFEGSKPAGDRPEWLLDKYLAGGRTVEQAIREQAKAAAEQQKLIGKKAPKAEESAPAMDLSAIGKKFQEQRATGQFDEDVQAALQHFGISPDYVTTAEQAIKSQQRSAAEQQLGRPVDWERWNSWQAENLTEAQRTAALSLISEGDYSLLDKLVVKMEESAAAGEADADAKPKGKVGASPSSGKSSSGPSPRTPFRSREELSKAMDEAAGDHGKWKLIEARLSVTDPGIARG